MSSGCWKLPAALIVALSSSAAQAAPSLEMRLAVKCVKIAALSFADQEKESAADIAEAAVQSCRRHVLAAASAASKDAAAKGKPVRKSEAEKIVVDALVDGTKSFVIEMRGIARRSGPNFYREAAQRIASNQ